MGTIHPAAGGSNVGRPYSGEALRDGAIRRLRRRYPYTVRRVLRAFVRHLLKYGPATVDVVRKYVAIPPGENPKLVGAIQSLQFAGVIATDGKTRPSNRPEARSHRLLVWRIRDRRAAQDWLVAHPELTKKGVSA